MGTTYYGACHDCKQKIDLDNFYSWYGNTEELTSIDCEILANFHNDGFIYRALRLHFFIGKHNGHKLGVYIEDTHGIDDYVLVYPWPRQKEDQVAEIDFTDPKASRLIIKTKFGNIVIDVRGKDVNCFRFKNNIESSDKRVDTVLLPV